MYIYILYTIHICNIYDKHYTSAYPKFSLTLISLACSSDGLVVEELESQSRVPVFKITGSTQPFSLPRSIK